MSLSGTTNTYLPPTLDGLNIIEADAIYINGIPVDTENLVPYTGASKNVNLGNFRFETLASVSAKQYLFPIVASTIMTSPTTSSIFYADAWAIGNSVQISSLGGGAFLSTSYLTITDASNTSTLITLQSDGIANFANTKVRVSTMASNNYDVVNLSTLTSAVAFIDNVNALNYVPYQNAREALNMGGSTIQTTGMMSAGYMKITSSIANTDYAMSVSGSDFLEFTNLTTSQKIYTDGGSLWLPGNLYGSGIVYSVDQQLSGTSYLAYGTIYQYGTSVNGSGKYEIADDTGNGLLTLSKTTGLTISTLNITQVPSLTPSVALGLNGGGQVVSFAVPSATSILPLANTFTNTNTFLSTMTSGVGYTTSLNGVYTNSLNSLGFTSASFTTSGITGAYTPPLGTITNPSGSTYQITQTAAGRSIMAISGFTPSVGITYVFEFNINCTIGTATISVEQDNVLRSPQLYPLTTGFNRIVGSFTYDGTGNTVIFKIFTGVSSWNAQWDLFTLSTYSANITAPLTISASTIMTSLTASRALVLDSSKAISSSATTTTELGYLSGTTGPIQTQISNKVSKTGDTMTGDLTIANGAFINFFDGTLQGFINSNTASDLSIVSYYDLILASDTGLCQIRGNPNADGMNALQLTDSATTYGRTQLQMIGRYEASNDSWNRETGRNIIRFQYKTSKTSATTDFTSIQAYPAEGLGILINSSTVPSFIANNNGNITINSRELRINQLNSGDCQLRIKSGNTNIASMLHCNGTDLYFLCSTNGNWESTYNSLRPLKISLTSGMVTMDNSLTVNTIFSGDWQSPNSGRRINLSDAGGVNWIYNNTGATPISFSPSTWANGGYTVITRTFSNTDCGIGLGVSTNGGGVGRGVIIGGLRPGVAWGEMILSSGTIYTSCFGTINNYTNGGAWVFTSDKRVKKDIKPLKTSRSLERVMALKPMTYKKIYCQEKSETIIPQEIIDANHVGFLAQDVLETNPHCISKWYDDNSVCDGDDGTRLGIAYSDINIHMVGAIQELKKQNDLLLKQGQEAQRAYDAQQKEIDDLRQYKTLSEERFEKMGRLIEQLIKKVPA